MRFSRSAVFVMLSAAALTFGDTRTVRAAFITAPTVRILITLNENKQEQLDSGTIEERVEGNPNPRRGAFAIAANHVQFTFPFGPTFDPRFSSPPNRGDDPAISLQNLLFAAFDTTATGPHPQVLGGGDPMSYGVNANGLPVGTFGSDPGNDDDPREEEKDGIKYTAQRKVGRDTISQTFFVNYVVISPAEGGKPGEEAVPEPSSFALLGTGGLTLLGYCWRRWKRVAA